MSLRLSAATASALPASVRRPGYDRGALRAGVLHLGVGAFHRCHQAEYADDAIEAAGGDWGIVGVNLAPPDSAAALTAQDGLYCRELREGGAVERRMIGALLRVVAAADREAALAAACDPAIRVVTLTVTEKGYCHIPATGALDRAHPGVQRRPRRARPARNRARVRSAADGAALGAGARRPRCWCPATTCRATATPCAPASPGSPGCATRPSPIGSRRRACSSTPWSIASCRRRGPRTATASPLPRACATKAWSSASRSGCG